MSARTSTRTLAGLLGAWFVVAAALVALPAHAAQTEPAWPHQSLRAPDGAVAWVDAGVDPGGTMRVRGNGWTNRAGTAPSTIAIKLNSSAGGAQFTRTGAGIVAHPSAAGDSTIWVLLDAEPGSHRNQRQIEADGSFDITIDVPAQLTTGAYFTVSITSGLFQSGDQTRSLQSKPLEVAGEAWSDGGAGEDVTCVPTAATAAVEVVSASHQLGGELVLRGAGWCAENGGSRIGLKIDEGGISRLDSTLHSNRTIWAIIDARAEDGTFEASVRLPDGTTGTSTPALTEGVHTVRLLSGSLKPGDVVRSVSTEFQVGSYVPVFPEPVEATEQLTAATRNGVVAERRGARLVVTHPGATPGDWVALTVFEGASPRLPWGTTWFRVAADGTVRAPLGDAELPPGRVKLALQSGNAGEAGRLVGWTWVTLADADDPEQPPATHPGGTDPVTTPQAPTPTVPLAGPVLPTSTGVAPVAAPVLVAAPTPGAPVAAAGDLDETNAGGLIATQMGDRLRVSLPTVKPSRTVHVFVYPESGQPVHGGTAVTAADRSVKIGLTGAAPGTWKVAFVNRRGRLIGWVGYDVAPAQVSTASPVATPVRTAAVASTASADQVGTADWWLVGAAVVLVLGSSAVALRRTRKVG